MNGRLQALLASDRATALPSAWRWWRDELLGMLPVRARAAALARLRPVAIDLADDADESDDSTIVAAASASEASRGGLRAIRRPAHLSPPTSAPRDTDVQLRLPPQDVLRRPIDLPLAAARNLREILRFEVERLSPLDPAGIHWDWRVVERSRARNRLRVEVWFVKRQTVTRALRFCAARRLSPVSVGIIGAPDEVAVTRLLPRGAEPLGRRLRRWLVPAFVLLAVILGLLLLDTERDRQLSGVDQLRAHVAKAKTAAQAAERLHKDVQQASARAHFLAERKRQTLVVGVLADVTRHLPDDVWLIQVELAGREVRIQGFAPKASSLIEVFGQSAVFANPQFRAPVTRGPVRGPQGDVERFDLSFELRGSP